MRESHLRAKEEVALAASLSSRKSQQLVERRCVAFLVNIVATSELLVPVAFDLPTGGDVAHMTPK